MKIGKVIELWRYPVKSLLGERLDTVNINLRGVLGDREYAISDLNNKFGSGKDTRRFRRIDGLFSMSARMENNHVQIEFPDGRTLSNRDSSLNKQLSNFLGQEVTLSQEDKISHFDDGAIHIITTKSLELLQAMAPNIKINASRFRPNIVIESEAIDDEILGKKLKIGSVELEVTHKTERCRMITLAQSELENAPGILKTVSNNFDMHFGVYARVKAAGNVLAGDKVEIECEDS